MGLGLRAARGVACRLGAAVLAAAFVGAGPAPAQESGHVELRSADGSLTIDGELISYEDGVYLVDVPGLGQVRVESSRASCIGEACPDIRVFGPEFGIRGSRTVGTVLIPNLLRGYAADTGAIFETVPSDDPGVRIFRLVDPDGTVRAVIDLETRGSGSAFPALADGSAEIGIADRRMRDGDLAALAAAGIPDLRDSESEIVLGLDGIAVITNPDNPVLKLSPRQIADIWSGEITSWSELGGGDFPITVNSFGERSGDRAEFLDRLVRPAGGDERADVVRWDAYQDMVDAVIADHGGIGFAGRWIARTNDVNVVTIRESCGLLSPPSDFRIKSGDYVLARRLYAYTRPGVIHPEARAFLDWALSDAAQPYFKESNFVGRTPERLGLEDMGIALIHTAVSESDFDLQQFRSMVRELRDAARLSTSFRFRSGSSTLDEESLFGLADLLKRFEAGDYDGHEVLLVGFADSVGDQRRNTQLAFSRAFAVRDLINEALPQEVLDRVTIRAASYGELLPIACNSSAAGRARNRRVEVWLRLPGVTRGLR